MLTCVRHIITHIQEGLLQKIWLETKWIYQYVKHYRKYIFLYTVLGLVNVALSLGVSLASRDLVDVITGYKTAILLRVFCITVGLTVVNIITSQLTGFSKTWISTKVNMEIKTQVFSKIMITDLESISVYHTGDLLTRWTSDAGTIANGILNWIPDLIIYFFRFAGAFAIVLYYDASFAVFALISVPVSIILSRSIVKRMVANNEKVAAMNAMISGFNQETFSSIQTIKAFDMIPVYNKKLKKIQSDFFIMKMDYEKMSIAVAVLMSFVGILASYSANGWGIYRVWSGAISYGTMTLFLSMSATLTGAVNSMIGLVPTAIGLTTSASRLMDILNMPTEDYSLDEKVHKFSEDHQKNGISLKATGITYCYGTGTQVFENADLEAHPHEIIALVGLSGEGKTTMLRLILSLLRPQSGSILLEAGNDVLPLTPSARKMFSYVPQGNTMFSGTIADNLRNVKEDATDEEIMEVLKLACAWDFVSKLPKGIESELKERGGGLSEGQAQRLSIARALLRHSPILLLDEATSALDVTTERTVLKNIMADDYPRTCILTTHRPTVLTLCNRVYAIRNMRSEALSKEEITLLIKDF